MSGGTLCPRARCPGGHSALGDILPSDTGNGGLGYYVIWTRFCDDGNMPTHNVVGSGQFNPPWSFCQQLRTSQVPIINNK